MVISSFKQLIISPHIDDEVLGCFSQMKLETFICCLGDEDREYASVTQRK
jgi:hypothetical protein